MEFKSQVLETSAAERRRVYGQHHIQDQWPQYGVFGSLLIINAVYYSDGRSSLLILAANAVIVLLLIFNAVRAFGSKPVQERFAGYRFGVRDGQPVAIKVIGVQERVQPLQPLRYFERPAYFLVYFAKNKYYYVPKRLFSTDAEITAFRNSLSAPSATEGSTPA